MICATAVLDIRVFGVLLHQGPGGWGFVRLSFSSSYDVMASRNGSLEMRYQGRQQRCLLRLWVTSLANGDPDLDGSFLAWKGDHLIGWGRAFVERACVLSAPSDSRCIGNVIIGELSEEPVREKGHKGIYST